MVYVNVVLADSPELPFGGVKRCGTSREMGLLAADEFVNKKLIRVAQATDGRARASASASSAHATCWACPSGSRHPSRASNSVTAST